MDVWLADNTTESYRYQAAIWADTLDSCLVRLTSSLSPRVDAQLQILTLTLSLLVRSCLVTPVASRPPSSSRSTLPTATNSSTGAPGTTSRGCSTSPTEGSRRERCSTSTERRSSSTTRCWLGCRGSRMEMMSRVRRAMGWRHVCWIRRLSLVRRATTAGRKSGVSLDFRFEKGVKSLCISMLCTQFAI